MARFDLAAKIVLKGEGGYNKGFTGSGETYKGLDRNHTATWAGWKIIDRIKNKRKDQIFPNPELDSLVKQFYKTKMWDVIRGDKIQDQQLANMLFDFYFHKPLVAITAANKAAIETYPGTLQVNDRKLTLNVIDVMNDYPADMFAKIQELRLKHYNNEWMNKEVKAFYTTTRKGLLNRANKFVYKPADDVAGIFF
jgi:hypothetical protein